MCSALSDLVAQTVNNLPSLPETRIQSMGWEDLLEEGMAAHFSILAWKIHGQRNPAGYSPWSRKESDTTERLNIFILSLLDDELFFPPLDGGKKYMAWVLKSNYVEHDYGKWQSTFSVKSFQEVSFTVCRDGLASLHLIDTWLTDQLIQHLLFIM